MAASADWVPDAIFYQIFPDRFARSASVAKPAGLDAWGARPTPRAYQGGDLVGVCEKLDYLADLGVTALYLNPIFQSACNHRYHTHDYEKVDPMLGGDAALRSLFDQAHARGMRVILDGVFNHAARGFFQFNDILENGAESAYLDWFHIKSFPLYAYEPDKEIGYGAWWNLPALPKFNTDTPAVREFLLKIAERWIAFGADGWRLDVPNEIDDDAFWREFAARVRAIKPDAYIVGEVWTPAERWLSGDMWDAVMNYQFTHAALSYFIGDAIDRDMLKRTSLFPPGEPGAVAFAKALDRLHNRYRPETTAVQYNLLGSHDMARFLSLAGGDKSALELAALFQMTYSGAPAIYYGDEIGMTGGHDPENRAAFPWHDPDSWDRETLHRFQRLIALRKERICLRRGTYQMLLADNDVHVHLRQHEDDFAIVAINAGGRTERVDIPVGPAIADGVLAFAAWSRQAHKVEGGRLREVELAPRSGIILLSATGA